MNERSSTKQHEHKLDKTMVGVFDSGLGGLSVWRVLAKEIQHESILYYADSAHCPYGGKTEEEVRALTSTAVDFLLEKGCRLIVIACNTATAAAIHYLREKYPHIPFVGMEPAVKPAAIATKTGTIGVLATRGTFQGGHFKKTKEQYAEGVTVITRAGDGLVELVEQQEIYTPKAHALIHSYIAPMLDARADHIVLGCTHYPFLIPVLESIVGPTVQLVDPAPSVAKRVITLYQQLPQYVSPKLRREFYTTGDMKLMKHFLQETLKVQDPAVYFVG
ncbi:glutamate racemase [Algivirga pacifica]|uniref:Glutamate racemase n=1 Tax=Algivirga pacifica TaxID=1162670 RepID=A0ABP9DCJ9_9BACT